MEYSKDIVLGVKFFNGEDKHENLKLEGISKATINKEKICKVKINNKNKVVKFMYEHKFITSISIICIILMMLDCVLVYSFMELLQRL